MNAHETTAATSADPIENKEPGSPVQPVKCPYCDQQAELVQGKEIYPRAGPPQNGMYWLCRPCKAWTGTHKNSARFAPKGSLANAELRRARQEAHAAFDQIWNENLMSRKDAYSWLAGEMGVKVNRCHIGFFDVTQCVEAKRLAAQLFDDLTSDLVVATQSYSVFHVRSEQRKFATAN